MQEKIYPNVLITGGSRGVGQATALAFAENGWNVALTYRDKKDRAEKVKDQIISIGADAITIQGDITNKADIECMYQTVQSWTPFLNALILNASGGLERNKDENYPKQINIDGQLALIDKFRPMLKQDSTIVFVTSHWAHLYGRVKQLTEEYEVVAESKNLGEMAVRSQINNLGKYGIRLLVATGDVVDGTITAKLLERAHPGLADSRRNEQGKLISTEDMGKAIVRGVLNKSIPSGHTIVVGASLESLINNLN